jgi:hypothetical protein
MNQNRITALLPIFAMALLVLGAPQALALEQTGKITGTVYDPDGVPLAGVNVMVTSPQLMGERKVQTGEDGSFLFFGLPPGVYTLQVEQSGFLPYKNTELKVQIGGTLSLDVLLELPTAEETVVVTAKRPVVDKEKTNLGQNFDDEFLDEVPVGRSYQSVAQLAPGVTGGDNPNVHGSSMYGNQYLIDGINTTDPATNTWGTQFNYDAIKEVQVLTGGLDAEYGQLTGGLINVVTKSGSNEFHLDTSFRITPEWLRLRDEFEKEASADSNTYNFNFNVGGPIWKDKIWYYASMELVRRISYSPAHQDYFNPSNPNQVRNDPFRGWTLLYLGKVTFQASEKHKLTAMVLGDPAWFENLQQNPQYAPGVDEKRFQFGGFYSLAWEAVWTKNLFQRTQIGYSYSGMEQTPMSGCTDVNNPACRSHSDSSTGLTSVNWNRDSLDTRNRLQFDSSWTYYLDGLVGNHEWKAGWNYARTWGGFERFSYPGGGYYTDRNGQPYRFTRLMADADGVIRPYTETSYGNTLGVYLQDAWKPLKVLTIKPGVRFDFIQMMDEDMVATVKYLTTSPRLNMVWDITGDGKTVMRAGYNRYVDPGWFNVSSFLGGRALRTETYEYNPATGEYDIFFSRTPNEQTVVGSKNNTAPHADEFSLQVERELFTDFSLSVNGLYREFKHLFEDVEVNRIYNQDGSDIIGYQNGSETYIYQTQNPKEAWRRYWGFEIVARKAMSDNWQMSASYTYSRSEGSSEGYWTSFLDNPRQDPYYWSWTSFDVRHVIKADGSVHLPYGLEVGMGIEWSTGVPYSKYYKDSYYGSYYLYRAPRGYDPDHPNNPYWNRTPDTLSVSAQVVWDLKELTGQQIDVIGRMFNLMHLRYKTDLETSAYPPGSPREYGQYYAMTDGFYASLGLRYRY